MTPITFQFAPTSQDYTRTLRAFYASNPRYWFVLIPLALMLPPVLCGLPTLFVSGISRPEVLPLLLPALFIPGLLVAAYFLPLFLAARQVARNERLRAETSYTLDDETVIISNKYAETRLDWGSFDKVLETKDDYLLIYTINKRMFQFIPKRAFPSAELEAAFRDLVRHHIGQYQDRRAGTPRWLIAVVATVLVIILLLGIVAAVNTVEERGEWTAVGRVRSDSGSLVVSDPGYLPEIDPDLMFRLDGIAPGEYSVEVMLRDQPEWGIRPWQARVLFKEGARGRRMEVGEVTVDSGALSVIDPVHLDSQWLEIGPRRDGCLSGLDNEEIAEALAEQGYDFEDGESWCIAFSEPVSEEAEREVGSWIMSSGLRGMLFISTGSTYDRLVDAMEQTGYQWGGLPFADGKPGLISAFESGAGDGWYPVYGLYEDGAMVGLEIDMR